MSVGDVSLALVAGAFPDDVAAAAIVEDGVAYLAKTDGAAGDGDVVATPTVPSGRPGAIAAATAAAHLTTTTAAAHLGPASAPARTL